MKVAELDPKKQEDRLRNYKLAYDQELVRILKRYRGEILQAGRELQEKAPRVGGGFLLVEMAKDLDDANSEQAQGFNNMRVIFKAYYGKYRTECLEPLIEELVSFVNIQAAFRNGSVIANDGVKNWQEFVEKRKASEESKKDGVLLGA